MSRLVPQGDHAVSILGTVSLSSNGEGATGENCGSLKQMGFVANFPLLRSSQFLFNSMVSKKALKIDVFLSK